MALSSGMRLGPYEILAPLGAGGMGEVYRAKDVRLEREVAVKVLPASYARDADRLRRFWKEIAPSDPAGMDSVGPICLTPDGKSYAYGYIRILSGLYMVEGLK